MLRPIIRNHLLATSHVLFPTPNIECIFHHFLPNLFTILCGHPKMAQTHSRLNCCPASAAGTAGTSTSIASPVGRSGAATGGSFGCGATGGASRFRPAVVQTHSGSQAQPWPLIERNTPRLKQLTPLQTRSLNSLNLHQFASEMPFTIRVQPGE